MDRLHIVIEVGNGPLSAWAVPINQLGQADVDYKDERGIARELRRIADEFETGMSYQLSDNIFHLLTANE